MLSLIQFDKVYFILMKEKGTIKEILNKKKKKIKKLSYKNKCTKSETISTANDSHH